jgi:hypothetical protein
VSKARKRPLREPAPKPARVYLVERAALRAWDYEGLHYTTCSCDQGDSHVPVRAFADEAAAQVCCDALEAEARAMLPPALFASYSLPEGLAQRVKSLGLPALKLGRDKSGRAGAFRQWWGEHAARITPEQQAALWELFDDVKLYRVRSQKLE